MEFMRSGALWFQALACGGLAGLLTEVLVLRLNPEIDPTAASVLVGMALWMSWAGVAAGVPLALVLTLTARLLPEERRRQWWPAPGLVSGVFVAAAALSWANADLHAEYLSGTGHRTLGQDGVAWLIGALLAQASGVWVGRSRSGGALRVAFVCVFLALPMARVATQPTPSRSVLGTPARSLGVPDRPLLVVGIEGLDSGVLRSHADGGRYPCLARLLEDGAWGPLRPHRPYLRQSQWTSTATGCLPRSHGLKERWSWRLRWLSDEPLRLLPWFPGGSRVMLPWFAAQQEPPPASLVPPLWARLQASGVPTLVIGWPGAWDRFGPIATESTPPDDTPTSDDALADPALAQALNALGARGQEVIQAVAADRARLNAARDAFVSGAGNVWLHLGLVAEARRQLEPQPSEDPTDEATLELIFEHLDRELARLLETAGPETLTAVVSPVGLRALGARERLLQAVGFGGDARASARTCPDGLLILIGGERVARVQLPVATLPDVAPTLCYLLDLPVAQYMEGRVIVEAVEPAYLSANPLRVVN